MADPRPIVVRKLQAPAGTDLRVLNLRYQSLSRRLDANQLSLRSLYSRLRREFSIGVGWSEFRDIVQSESLVLNRPAVEVLSELVAKRRIRVMLTSNTSRYVWAGLARKFRINRLFRNHVLSFRIGTLKPSRRFFRVALERARCEPRDATLLDDTKANVIAARRLGITAQLVSGASDASRRLRSFQ